MAADQEFVQVLAQLAVSDVHASAEWTRKVIGRTEDEWPMASLASWYLDPAGVLQLTQDPDRAGGSTVTLVVVDIDASVARLNRAGIDAEVDDDTSGKFRLVMLSDLDGNSVTLVEVRAEAQ